MTQCHSLVMKPRSSLWKDLMRSGGKTDQKERKKKDSIKAYDSRCHRKWPRVSFWVAYGKSTTPPGLFYLPFIIFRAHHHMQSIFISPRSCPVVSNALCNWGINMLASLLMFILTALCVCGRGDKSSLEREPSRRSQTGPIMCWLICFYSRMHDRKWVCTFRFGGKMSTIPINTNRCKPVHTHTEASSYIIHCQHAMFIWLLICGSQLSLKDLVCTWW